MFQLKAQRHHEGQDTFEKRFAIAKQLKVGVNPNGIQLSVTASILICCEKSLFMHFQKDL